MYGDFVASDIRQPAFDTSAAASLLEQAGYKDSNGDGVRESDDGTPLSFTLTYKSTLSNADGVMTILKSGCAEAGVELVLQPVDAATFSANVTQGHKYDISYSSWGTIDDVDTTLLTCFGIGQTLNFMEFNDPDPGGPPPGYAGRNRLPGPHQAAGPVATVVRGEPALRPPAGTQQHLCD